MGDSYGLPMKLPMLRIPILALAVQGEPGHWPARSLRHHRTAEGQASEVSVQMPEHGLTWHDQQAAAISSEFRWNQTESGLTQDFPT